MPALPVSQESDWNNNVYVIATTRAFVMIGIAYLVKSLYNLVPSIWGTRSASIAAGRLSFPFNIHRYRGGAKSRSLTTFFHRIVVAEGIDLEDVISDAPVTVPGAVGTSPDLDANLTLEFHPPQPSYDPHSYAERSRADARAQNQSREILGSPNAVTQEQDVGVRNGEPHIEEDMDFAVGLTG